MNRRTQTILRIAIALIVGLVVTGIALNAAKNRSQVSYYGDAQGATRKELKWIAISIAQYRQQTHSLPRSLNQLDSIPDRDPWGYPFDYVVQGSSYRVTSYGHDGKPGGVGFDCDISNVNPNPPEAALSYQQFLTDPWAKDMVWTCLTAGGLTFVLCFLAVRPNDLYKEGLLALAVKLIVTLLMASFIAVIMAALHVPSGH